MNSFANLVPFQLWVLGLCVAVMLGILAATAIVVSMWRERPIKRDITEDNKLRERLSQIAQPVVVQSRRPAA